MNEDENKIVLSVELDLSQVPEQMEEVSALISEKTSSISPANQADREVLNRINSTLPLANKAGMIGDIASNWNMGPEEWAKATAAEKAAHPPIPEGLRTIQQLASTEANNPVYKMANTIQSSIKAIQDVIKAPLPPGTSKEVKDMVKDLQQVLGLVKQIESSGTGRGRGRPPKAKEATEPSSGTVTQVSFPTDGSDADVAPKRGRGRPKGSGTKQTDQVTVKPEGAIKENRGRPGKNSKAVVTQAADPAKAAEAHANFVADNPPPPKKPAFNANMSKEDAVSAIKNGGTPLVAQSEAQILEKARQRRMEEGDTAGANVIAGMIAALQEKEQKAVESQQSRANVRDHIDPLTPEQIDFLRKQGVREDQIQLMVAQYGQADPNAAPKEKKPTKTQIQGHNQIAQNARTAQQVLQEQSTPAPIPVKGIKSLEGPVYIPGAENAAKKAADSGRIKINGRGEEGEEFHYSPNEGKANIPHGIIPGIKGQIGTPGLANSAEEEQQANTLRSQYRNRLNRQARADNNNRTVEPMTQEYADSLQESRRQQFEQFSQLAANGRDDRTSSTKYNPADDPEYAKLENLRQRLAALEKQKNIVQNRPETALTRQDVFGEFTFRGEQEWQKIDADLTSLEKYRMEQAQAKTPTSDRTQDEPRSVGDQVELDAAKKTNADTTKRLFKGSQDPIIAAQKAAQATAPIADEETKKQMESLKKDVLSTYDSQIADLRSQLTEARISFNDNLRGRGSNLVYNQRTGKMMDNGFEYRIATLKQYKKQLEDLGTMTPNGVTYSKEEKGKFKYFNEKANKLRKDIEAETGGAYTLDKDTLEFKQVHPDTDETLQVKKVTKQDPLAQSFKRKPAPEPEKKLSAEEQYNALPPLKPDHVRLVHQTGAYGIEAIKKSGLRYVGRPDATANANSDPEEAKKLGLNWLRRNDTRGRFSDQQIVMDMPISEWNDHWRGKVDEHILPAKYVVGTIDGSNEPTSADGNIGSPPPPNKPPVAQASPEPEPKPRKGIISKGEGNLPLPNQYYPEEFPHENDDKQPPAFIAAIHNAGESEKPEPTDKVKVNDEANRHPKSTRGRRQSLTAQFETEGLTMSAEDEAALKAARNAVGNGYSPAYRRMMDSMGKRSEKVTPLTPEEQTRLEQARKEQQAILDNAKSHIKNEPNQVSIFSPDKDPRVQDVHLWEQEVGDIKKKLRQAKRAPNLTLPREQLFNIEGQYDDHNYDADLHYYVDKGEINQVRFDPLANKWDNQPRSQSEKDELESIKKSTREQAQKLFGNKPNYNQQELEEALRNQPLAKQSTKEDLERSQQAKIKELEAQLRNANRQLQSTVDKLNNDMIGEGTGLHYERTKGDFVPEEEWRKSTATKAMSRMQKAKKEADESATVGPNGITRNKEADAKYEAAKKEYDRLAAGMKQFVEERSKGTATWDYELGTIRDLETNKPLQENTPRSVPQQAKPKSQQVAPEKINQLRQNFEKDYEELRKQFASGQITPEIFQNKLESMANLAGREGYTPPQSFFAAARQQMAAPLQQLREQTLQQTAPVQSITEKVNNAIGDIKTPGTALQPGERTAALEKSRAQDPLKNISQPDLKKLRKLADLSDDEFAQAMKGKNLEDLGLHPDTVKAIQERAQKRADERAADEAKLPVQKSSLTPSLSQTEQNEKDLKDKLQQRADTIAALRQTVRDLKDGKKTEAQKKREEAKKQKELDTNLRKVEELPTLEQANEAEFNKSIKKNTLPEKSPFGPAREGYKLDVNGNEVPDTSTPKGKKIADAEAGLADAFKSLAKLIGQVNDEYEKQKGILDKQIRQVEELPTLEQAQKAATTPSLGHKMPIGPTEPGMMLDHYGAQVPDPSTMLGKQMLDKQKAADDFQKAQEKEVKDAQKARDKQQKEQQQAFDKAQAQAKKEQKAAQRQAQKDAEASIKKMQSSGGEDDTGAVVGKIGLGLRKGVGWARRTAGFGDAGAAGMIGGFTALAGSEIFNKVTQALGELADQAKQTAQSVKDFGGSSDKIRDSQFSLNAAKTAAANNPGVADMSNFFDTLQNRFWGGVGRVGTAIHGIGDFFSHIGESDEDRKKRQKAEQEAAKAPTDMAGDTKIQYDTMIKQQGETQKQMQWEREQAEHDIFTQRRDYALKGQQLDQDAQHQYEDFAQRRKFTDQDYALSKEKLETDVEFKTQQKKFEIARQYDQKKLDQNIANEERTAATSEKYIGLTEKRQLKYEDTKFGYQQSDKTADFQKTRSRELEDYQNELIDMSFSGASAIDYFKKSRDTRLALKRQQEDFNISKSRETRDYQLQRQNTVDTNEQEKAKRKEELANTEKDQKERFNLQQAQDLEQNKADVESHYVQLRFQTLDLEKQHNQTLEQINLNLKQFNENLALQKQQYANEGADMAFSQGQQWQQLQLGQQQQAFGMDQEKMQFAWQLYNSVGHDNFVRLAEKNPDLWTALDRYTKQANIGTITHDFAKPIDNGNPPPGQTQSLDEKTNYGAPSSGTQYDPNKPMNSADWAKAYANRIDTTKGGDPASREMSMEQWVEAVKAGKIKLPSYATGGYIDQDQIANIHKGEYIINPNNPDRTGQMGILNGAIAAMKAMPVGGLASTGGSSALEMSHSVQIGDTVYNGLQSESLVKDVNQAHEDFQRNIQRIVEKNSETLRKEFGRAMQRVIR